MERVLASLRMNWGRKEQEQAILAGRRQEQRCSNPGGGRWSTDVG